MYKLNIGDVVELKMTINIAFEYCQFKKGELAIIIGSNGHIHYTIQSLDGKRSSGGCTIKHHLKLANANAQVLYGQNTSK